MRISDWSSDVCSSDLGQAWFDGDTEPVEIQQPVADSVEEESGFSFSFKGKIVVLDNGASLVGHPDYANLHKLGSFSTIVFDPAGRSEEHTSELQSLMRISYAVFCLKKKNKPLPTINKRE